jgi:hypothetical protein
MASTRNRNQRADYNLNKRQSVQHHDHMLDTTYALNRSSVFMELGSNPKFSGEVLAKNSVDVESMLRGIRSTNLEGPSFYAKPKTNSLPHTAWFERGPVVMPEPFFHSYTQRPNYLN